MVISTTTSFNFVTPFTNFEGQKFVLQDRTRTVEPYLRYLGESQSTYQFSVLHKRLVKVNHTIDHVV